jgi:hypothetical protein
MGVQNQGNSESLQPEQLLDESEEFVCKVCMLVLNNPMVTICSHLVCNTCMQEWVEQNRAKAQKKNTALGEVPCPVCNTPLKREQVAQLQQQDGGGALLWRMYNELTIRCLHHPKIQAEQPDGVTESAAEAIRAGLSCTWEGPRVKWLEHCKICPGMARNSSEAKKAPSVASAPDVPYTGPAPEQRKVEDVVVAAADYSQSTDASVLSFESGDVLDVFYYDPSGWTYGRIQSSQAAREGWFPRDWTFPHTEMKEPQVQHEPASAAAPAATQQEEKQGSEVRAINAYEARSPQEHTVRQGELVRVIRIESQWALIQSDEGGKLGWVPSWVVKAP